MQNVVGKTFIQIMKRKIYLEKTLQFTYQWWCVVKTFVRLTPSASAALRTVSGSTGSTIAACFVFSSVI